MFGHILSPKNCPFAWGDLDPHLVNGYLDPPESTTQTASQSVDPSIFRINMAQIRSEVPRDISNKKLEAKDVLLNTNRMQAAGRAEKCPFLSLVTLTFDLDFQTHLSKGQNMSSV